MSTRTKAIVEQLREVLEGIRSHLPQLDSSLEKLVDREDTLQQQVNETVETLRLCVVSIEDLVANQAIHALPMLDLTEIHTICTSLLNSLPQVATNIEQHQGTFTTLVDTLHRRLWNMSLINVDEETRNYMASAGKLKEEIEQAKEIIDRLREGLLIRDHVQEASDEVAELKKSIETNVKEIQGHQSSSADSESKTQLHMENAQEALNSLSKLLELGETKETTISQIETELTKWHVEIEEKRKVIDELRESTGVRLKEYDTDIKNRQNKLNEIDSKIDEQFRLASSGALAKAFGELGNRLMIGKIGWGTFAIISYFVAVSFAYWIASQSIPEPLANGKTPPLELSYFLVRLAVGIPIGFFVWFVTIQFGKARRLQEAYAFKGAVASSFDAYRDVIEKIAKDPKLKERPEYADFITRTIGDLYKPPPSGSHEDDQPPQTKVLKEVIKSLEPILALLKK